MADRIEVRRPDPAVLALHYGSSVVHVRELEAEMIVRGEPVSTFRRAALPGALIGECRFEARMPEPDGELRIVIDLGDARRRLSRAVHIEDGAMVRIDLAPELARPAR